MKKLNKPTVVFNSKADWNDIVNLVEETQKEIDKLDIKNRQGKRVNLMSLVTKKASGGSPKENYDKALEIISRYVNLIDIKALCIFE